MCLERVSPKSKPWVTGLVPGLVAPTSWADWQGLGGAHPDRRHPVVEPADPVDLDYDLVAVPGRVRRLGDDRRAGEQPCARGQGEGAVEYLAEGVRCPHQVRQARH